MIKTEPKKTKYSVFKKNWEFISENIKVATGVSLVLMFVAALLFLFIPVNRTTTVTGFKWSRAIEVEEYTLCHESDWNIPVGGRETGRDYRIHHYDHVIDHYETKTRTVTEQVLVGYDTHYTDLGNGQASVSQTPKYETKTRIETYEEPVYRDDPVYRWYYFYDIDRWLHSDWLKTENYDQDPYWYDTDLPTNIDSPEYGDLKQSTRKETYTVLVVDDKRNSSSFERNQSDDAGL